MDIGRYGEVSKRFDILFLLFFSILSFKKNLSSTDGLLFYQEELKEEDCEHVVSYDFAL